MDIGQPNGVVFVDLKKAFDTSDHKILLNKLDLYGLKVIAHTWIRNLKTGKTDLIYLKVLNTAK